MSHGPRIPASRTAGGFTLVEMVVSLAVLSVLLLACGSIVGMATRATGDAATRDATQLKAADVVGRMTDDLNVALNFTQRAPTGVTFTVPDRLGTGTPQVVSYQWSGTPGDPLTRQFNGVTAIALPGVQSLGLSFATRLMGPTPQPAEQDIYSRMAGNGTPGEFKLADKAGVSQCFRLNLPVGTNAYAMTGVRVRLKSDGAADGAIRVGIRMPDVFGRPTGTTLAQTVVYESALSSDYEWVEIPFSNLTNLNPTQALCVVLENADGTKNSCKIQTDESPFGVSQTAFWSETDNSGASWSFGTTAVCARFSVTGTVP